MKTVNIREVPLSEIIDLPVYPTADILPMLEKNASKREEGKTKTITLAELADSINEYGLQEPIVLFDSENGKFLLDGRNRRAACIMAAQVGGDSANEFMVQVEDFIGTEEEADEFVFTAGLDRRDLEASQRAMSAAKFEHDPATADAFARMKEKARSSQGTRTDLQLLCTDAEKLDTSAEVAQMLADKFRCSVRYVYEARKIIQKKVKALKAADEAAKRAVEQEKIEEEERERLEKLVEIENTSDLIIKEALLADYIAIYGPIQGEIKDEKRDASTKANNASNHKVEERDKSNEASQEASKAASLEENIHNGDTTISGARQEDKDSDKDEREVAITKAASQFNDGYNKVIKSGEFLLKEGRDNDHENVRLKTNHIHEKFGSLEEVHLQTQHYFPTEREPSDVASRWAGEVRIRLAGVDRMIQEKDVIPSMITENVEFLGVIDRLREFLDNVEKSLNDES